MQFLYLAPSTFCRRFDPLRTFHFNLVTDNGADGGSTAARRTKTVEIHNGEGKEVREKKC